MNLLFCLSLFLVPVNAIYGFSGLGELSSDSSAYIYLPMILIGLISISKSPTNVPWHLQIFVGFFLIAVSLSFFVNLHEIVHSEMKGRGGLGRSFTTIAVPLAMVAFASIASQLIRSEEDAERLLARPLAFSVLMCGLFAIPEIGQHFSPIFTPINDTIDLLFRYNGISDPDLPRVHSICFEPPSLSYIMALIFPWLMYGHRFSKIQKSDKRFLYRIAIGTNIFLLIVSLSRTGMVMMFGTIVLEFVYYVSSQVRRDYLKIWIIRIFNTSILTAIFLFCFVYYNYIAYDVSVGDSTSNISRLAESIAAIDIFKANPLFGVGFGQFGFNALNFLPSWAWISFEINGWYLDPLFFWPPMFNMYLRLSAETGIIGVAFWCIYWPSQMTRVFVKAQELIYSDPKRSVLMRSIHHTILSFMLGGLSYDSFKSIIVWAAVGCIGIASLKEEEDLPQATPEMGRASITRQHFRPRTQIHEVEP